MVAPEVGLKRFNCPHCGAFAAQAWYSVGARSISNSQTLSEFDLERRLAVGVTHDAATDENYKRYLKQGAELVGRGELFIYTPTRAVKWDMPLDVCNLFVSRCESCNQVATWISAELVWPPQSAAPLPNADLPPDIAADYIEAGRIVGASPRGAAALLRLAIQKLCNEATGKEQTIAKSITQLEQGGLALQIVDALHIVRVVGNESVHPGSLDVRDDPEIAHRLFELVNRIADTFISQPKRAKELWDKLPQAKRDEIERARNKAP
jgi:hypothetical protein